MKVNVRINQSMLELLGGDPEFFEMPINELSSALLQKAATPLTEIDGCVVPALNPSVTWVDDETGTECFWSKFHLEDFLSETTSLEEVARTALDFVWPLRAAVAAARLSGSFRMIASIELPGLAQTRPSCTVRFHRIRPGQAWIAENLESYKHEAIMVCDFTVPW
jgi:hypothetical protein